MTKLYITKNLAAARLAQMVLCGPDVCSSELTHRLHVVHLCLEGFEPGEDGVVASVLRFRPGGCGTLSTAAADPDASAPLLSFMRLLGVVRC